MIKIEDVEYSLDDFLINDDAQIALIKKDYDRFTSTIENAFKNGKIIAFSDKVQNHLLGTKCAYDVSKDHDTYYYTIRILPLLLVNPDYILHFSKTYFDNLFFNKAFEINPKTRDAFVDFPYFLFMYNVYTSKNIFYKLIKQVVVALKVFKSQL